MSKLILVIEDEGAIQRVIKAFLENEGYNVILAEDGLEGIDLFREQQPDLVLLDLMLPKISGFTVCEMIRRESKTPIIMLTALDEEEAQVKAFELKVDDYITKPFSVRLVRMRVEAVLRRVQERENKELADVLSWGNIRLERSSRSVTVSGKAVGLTNTEYGLLELFLLHPGRVFTRDNLLNQVWGYDFVGEEKTVNIHIMNLRRKLNTDCLQTVRGVGYKLVQENQK